MRIFILEDNPERIIAFHECFGTHAQFIQTSNRWTEFEPPYDYVFLDHDLGGREGERHEDCGLTFLMQTQRRLEEMPRDERAYVRVIIHSYNGDAVGRMLDYLEAKVPGLKAEWMPFLSPQFNALMAKIKAEIGS